MVAGMKLRKAIVCERSDRPNDSYEMCLSCAGTVPT